MNKELPAWQNLSLKDLPGEEWRDIEETAGYCQISNFGRVKSLTREVNCGKGKIILPARIRRQHLDKRKTIMLKLGFHIKEIGLYKTLRPAILVAKAFLNKSPTQLVFHRDIDITNNHVSNLYLKEKEERGDALADMLHLKKQINKKFTSFYKGVRLHVNRGGNHIRYYAMQIISKKNGLLIKEYFSTEEEAARAYDYYVDKYKLNRKKNFPNE